jgi:hypothetical protein
MPLRDTHPRTLYGRIFDRSAPGGNESAPEAGRSSGARVRVESRQVVARLSVTTFLTTSTMTMITQPYANTTSGNSAPGGPQGQTALGIHESCISSSPVGVEAAARPSWVRRAA